jgi:hypothetical protein
MKPYYCRPHILGAQFETYFCQMNQHQKFKDNTYIHSYTVQIRMHWFTHWDAIHAKFKIQSRNSDGKKLTGLHMWTNIFQGGSLFHILFFKQTPGSLKVCHSKWPSIYSWFIYEKVGGFSSSLFVCLPEATSYHSNETGATWRIIKRSSRSCFGEPMKVIRCVPSSWKLSHVMLVWLITDWFIRCI